MTQRIDKWLWYARFAKTRTLAQWLATSGHVRVNRQKSVTAASPVRIGDVLTISTPATIRVLRVAAYAERRGPPSEAHRLYEELSAIPDNGGRRTGTR